MFAAGCKSEGLKLNMIYSIPGKIKDSGIPQGMTQKLKMNGVIKLTKRNSKTGNTYTYGCNYKAFVDSFKSLER